MNAFSLIVALGPIALYWVLLGYLHLRTSPMILSGGRDMTCLGLACLGLFLIGPAELFFPTAAFNLLGISVWLAILLLYATLLLFLVINTRPRLVVYGLTEDQLVHHTRATLAELDPTAAWLGEHFVAPILKIEGVIEQAGVGSVSQIISTRTSQSVLGWIELERGLRRTLSDVKVVPSSQGRFWLPLGVVILLAIAYALVKNPNEIAEGFQEMMRL